MNTKSRLHLTMAVVAVSGIALAGCGSSAPVAPSAAAASYAATSSAPLPSSAAPSSAQPSVTASASPTPTVTECTAAQLKIAYTSNRQIRNGALDGMSHADNVVTFTNTGAAPCRTGGYPGVAALNSAGKQIKQAIRSPGTGATLVLAPGQTASAMVSANTASCVKPAKVAGLLVTAPNERTSTRLGSPGALCLGSLAIGTLKRGNAAGLKL